MLHVTYLNMCWWNVNMWVTLQNPNFLLVSQPTTATLRLEYCRKKGISWIIEQPSSSLLPLYKPLEAGVGTEVPLLILSKKIGSTSQQLALFICPDCFGLNLKPKTAIYNNIRCRHWWSGTRQRSTNSLWEWWGPTLRSLDASWRKMPCTHCCWTTKFEKNSAESLFLFSLPIPSYFHRDTFYRPRKRTILISNAPWMVHFPCPSMTFDKRTGSVVGFVCFGNP